MFNCPEDEYILMKKQDYLCQGAHGKIVEKLTKEMNERLIKVIECQESHVEMVEMLTKAMNERLMKAIEHEESNVKIVEKSTKA